MLLRLAYLGVTNAFAVPRPLPMSDREKDMEILALRHQITVLERRLSGRRVRFEASDRAFLAALLQGLPLSTTFNAFSPMTFANSSFADCPGDGVFSGSHTWNNSTISGRFNVMDADRLARQLSEPLGLGR